MNVWSVLAGLLVTVGASAGAVLKTGDPGWPAQPASGEDPAIPILNLTVPLPFGGDGNGTGPEGNETQPPGNETAPPQEPAAAPEASLAACNEVAIQDWGDGLGGARAEWAFTLGAGNQRLDFELDLGSLLGAGLGSAAHAELVDPSGEVVASAEHGADGFFGPSAYMVGSVDAPAPGLWRLSVHADGMGGSYYVSAVSGCGAEGEPDDSEGSE